MKLGGYRYILILILLILFLSCPTYANAVMIKPTVSRFFFEKDGLPYDQSVTFTVNCYRYLLSPARNDSTTGTTNKTIRMEKALSFSGNCRYYGCSFEDLTSYAKFYTDTCDLEGRTMGELFIIRNFSNIPAMYCIDPLHQYDVQNGKWSNYSYYKFTPEYQDCMKRIQPFKDQCRQYTYDYSCSVNRSRCGGHTKVGDEDVTFNDADAYTGCIAPYDREKETCEHFLSPVDPSSMIFTKYNYTPSRYCESRFTIPSYIETPTETPNLTRQKMYPSITPFVSITPTPSIAPELEITPASTIAPFTPQSLVASLYCSIVQFLGGRCE
jgi:hypothetical protein